jgi:hypothetical protein
MPFREDHVMSTLVSPSPTPTLLPPREIRRLETLAALTMQPLHLISLLVCVVFFCGWLLIEHEALPPRAVVFFGLLVLNIYYLGRLLLHALPLDSSLARSFALIFLTGSLSWALLLLALHSLLPGSLPCHMLILLSVSAAGQYWVYRREKPAREEHRAAWLSLFVVFFSLAAATCWARGLLHSMQAHEGQVEFHHWMDYFDHSTFTSQLRASEHLWHFGNFQISHLPTPLYHYGSYLFTACLADFSSLSSYTTVVAFWTPFGTFLTGLAAFVLACSFGGRVAGLCALISLLVLPDASYYGFHNALFRYHWLQQIGSAGMYGAACAALGLVFLLEAKRMRSRRALVAGLGFGAATFFFKAQLFVVLQPLLIAWLILSYRRFSIERRILVLQAVVGLALAGIVISNRLHLGPTLEPSLEYFEHYCKYAASEGEPGVPRTVVENGAAAIGRSRYYFVATSLVLFSSFGALLGVLPLLCLGAWWKKKLHPVDLVPWLAVAIYALFLVGLKDNVVGLNWWELIHRPFVWPYFVLMVWSAGKCCLLLRETGLGQRLLRPKLIGAAGLLLLCLPWHMGRNVQQGRTIWRSKCYGLRFPQGLLECARFIAANGSRDDCIQDSQYDEYLFFGGLSERRSYLARPKLWKQSKNPAVLAEIERRHALLEQLKTATTAAAMHEQAAQLGIRWFLLHPDDDVRWPRAVLQAPAFVSDGYRVFDLAALPSAPGHPPDRIADNRKGAEP